MTESPDAGHGFLNDHDPAELPIWAKAIAKLAAAGYLRIESIDRWTIRLDAGSA